MQVQLHGWKRLASVQQLCDGGPLASIVFCCDPRRKRCPVLERALRELGLTVEEFVSVMERRRVPVPEVDGSCYGNLAFCPSLEAKSRDRDEFLLRSDEWSVSKYLEYKYELLLDLVPCDKLDYAFSRSVVEKYAGVVINTNTGRALAVVLVGNPELGGFRILRVEDAECSYVDNAGYLDGYLNVRLPRDVVAELESLVKAGVIRSKSDAARRAILLFLQAVKRAF